MTVGSMRRLSLHPLTYLFGTPHFGNKQKAMQEQHQHVGPSRRKKPRVVWGKKVPEQLSSTSKKEPPGPPPERNPEPPRLPRSEERRLAPVGAAASAPPSPRRSDPGSRPQNGGEHLGGLGGTGGGTGGRKTRRELVASKERDKKSQNAVSSEDEMLIGPRLRTCIASSWVLGPPYL